MTIEKIAELYAKDWYTINPKFRTSERLSMHIWTAIIAALKEVKKCQPAEK